MAITRLWKEIRDRYELGKVDAVFHSGDSEVRPDSPQLWGGHP